MDRKYVAHISKNRIFYLDFIRVAAMLMVIVFHFSTGIQSRLENPDIFMIGNINILNFGGVNLTLGNYGVSLFLIVSGASLMYVYQDKIDLKHYYIRRMETIYPLYYLAFAAAFLFQIITERKGAIKAPIWTFILTILGVDGWLEEIIPNHALVGDWFIGCIVCIYLLFPVFLKCMNRNPHLTIGIYTLIFLLWEYFYPFDFPKRNSIVLRSFEVLLGMYFMKMRIKVTRREFLFSLLVFLMIVFVRINWISLYVLLPVAGMAAFILLNYISNWVTNDRIMKIISWLSNYSFSIFLVHHFILKRLFSYIKVGTLNIVEALMVWLLYLSMVLVAGFSLKKLEGFLFKRKRIITNEN